MIASKEDFAQAQKELAQGVIDEGILAMARSRSLGDESKKMAIYLEIRARELSKERIITTSKNVLQSAKREANSIMEYIGVAFAAALYGGIFVGTVLTFGILPIFGVRISLLDGYIFGAAICVIVATLWLNSKEV